MPSLPLVRWFLTASDTGARLAEQAAPSETSRDDGRPVVIVDSTRRFQVMEGFGGAFTEAAAVAWLALGPEQREVVLCECFDPVRGHGYTLCRVHINSCDFALGHYAHVEKHGDTDLESFSIERDRTALLPFIQAAQRVAGRPIKLLASPWSPPAWMKSNGQMNNGGALLPQYRSAWADCFVKFIQAYAQHGVQIWAVSTQNEPLAVQRWDSCIYSAEGERDFVRDYLGPALAHAQLDDVKILIWDHNRDRMVERASVVYGDPQAAKYVWGTGFHWYGENHFDHVQLVHDAWPEKQLLFTEGCQEGGPHHGDWGLGERYARSMIKDLNRWTVGWIDWNLLLDMNGGPNHVGNYCSAPLLVDASRDTVHRQSSYYYIGHLARFVQPGARRVLCAASREALECTAFVNPDGSTIVVVMNATAEAIPFALHIGSVRVSAELPMHSIGTWVCCD